MPIRTRALSFSAINYEGVTLAARPPETWIVNGLCYVIFASFV
ncbi:MAG: hypothetical protein ACRDVC_06900 [Acidimicrobiales bacterium]